MSDHDDERDPVDKCPKCGSEHFGHSLNMDGGYQSSRCLDCRHMWKDRR